MFGFLKSLLAGRGMPKPAGPPRQIATVDSGTNLISEHASWDEGAVVVRGPGKETVRHRIPSRERRAVYARSAISNE